MKQFFLPLFLVAAFFSCAKKSTITVKGKITNPLAENVVIQNNFLDKNDTLQLADDGSFSTELEIDKEYLVYLRNGNLGITAYLKPGAILNFEFDGDDFKNDTPPNTVVSGPGSEESALLYALSNKNLHLSTELLKLPADSFSMKLDSVSAEVEDLMQQFNANNKGSEEFIEIATLIKSIDNAQLCSYFIMYHPRMAPADTAEVPSSYQQTVDAIPVGQYEKYKGINEFVSFVNMKYQTGIQDEMAADTTIKRGTLSYYNKYIDKIAEMEAPEEVKERIAFSYVGSYSYMPDSVQELFKKRYQEIVHNDSNIAEFEKTVATIEKTKPGTVAPTFNYEDINGNMVSSESFKGKVVYIDVWATWCGPCRGEIPSLKKMEEELHGEPIAFVSISIDDDKKAWEKMVKEDKLGGYQLFAEGAWKSSITNAYAIRGIPRFIMVDKEGLIVNANATRPSNPATKTKLMELAAR